MKKTNANGINEAAKTEKDTARFVVTVKTTGAVSAEPFNGGDSYGQLSDAVGGFIELAPILNTIKTKGGMAIDCFVNAEGVLNELPVNPIVSSLAGRTIVGDAIFAAHNRRGDTLGLTKADADSLLRILADA